jgi:RNA polymerase sigma-70 factor (ECF subfamily)
MRPTLHRYCARMTGSVIDGEDVVQDAMLKALAAGPPAESIDNPRAWLVRIAHNTAVDFLRRRDRGSRRETDADVDTISAPEPPDPDTVSASLRTFMHLPTLQRAAVILKDVLDHPLEEVASITGSSTASAKSALQRGRERLRAIAREPEHVAFPALSDAARTRLTAYVDGFRSGDFDAVRAMLAEEVELELVAHFRQRGKGDVGGYFTRYAEARQWVYAVGAVEGQPAMVVYDRRVSLDTPAYFVVLAFEGDRVVRIRDFLFARYAMESVELLEQKNPEKW